MQKKILKGIFQYKISSVILLNFIILSLPLVENENKLLDNLNDNNSFDVSVNGEDEFVSVYHKDSYLIYRALCKLSMKSITDDHTMLTDPIVLQNK